MTCWADDALAVAGIPIGLIVGFTHAWLRGGEWQRQARDHREIRASIHERKAKRHEQKATRERAKIAAAEKRACLSEKR